MIARGASVCLSFVVPLALARLFSPEEYGTYKLLFLVAQTLFLVLPLGMAQSLYFFLPRTNRAAPYLFQSLVFLACAGLLAAGGLWVASGTLARAFNNPGFAWHAGLIGVYVLGLIGSMPLEIALTARGNTLQAGVAYAAWDVARSVAVIVPAAAGFGVFGVVAGVALAAALRLSCTYVVLLRKEKGPFLDRRALRGQLSYALPFGAAMALAIPQQYFHQYVVSARVDAAAFAVYAVGIFNLPLIDLLYTPTSDVLMVRLAELEREGALDRGAGVFREAVTRLGYLFLPLSVFLIAVAPEFITGLFTARYLGAVPVFRVAALGIVLASLPVDGALRACNETRFILMSYATKIALTVPLVLLGVESWGMLGAVTGWLVADAFGKGTLLARLPKSLGTTIRELLPGSDLARGAAASLIATAGVPAARAALGPGHHALWTVGVSAAAFGVLYLLALELLGTRVLRMPAPSQGGRG